MTYDTSTTTVNFPKFAYVFIIYNYNTVYKFRQLFFIKQINR